MKSISAASALALVALFSTACSTMTARGRRAAEFRRTEAALVAEDVRDPVVWDRLGSDAEHDDEDVARRAFDRAEALLWPDAGPRNVERLALPFEGRWRVTQGNRGDYSHARLADRFSWDFQMIDEHGDSNPSGSESPTAFFGFGAPVLAPADGVVELVENDVPDNLDGRRNRERPGGNFVVLRHASGEFSRFCHLQRGSAYVVVGQSVGRGEPIGRCGCSGNAVEPHLHYVLRVGPSSEDFSIPTRFDDARTGRGDGVPQEGDVMKASPGE